MSVKIPFSADSTATRNLACLRSLARPCRTATPTPPTVTTVFLIKDFTTVLSMKRDKRSVILSQLREIHDGQFRRDFGTGVTKIWNGRVSIVAAVTPVLDRHYSIFST